MSAIFTKVILEKKTVGWSTTTELDVIMIVTPD